MASEVMRREIFLLSKVKPVVVSMGDMAASGGYWVAMIPHVPVYADEGTLTGSIGVFLGKFSIADLLAKWGITDTTIKDGAHADAESLLHDYTPRERDQLRQLAQDDYDRFVNLVAKTRHLSVGRVREIASGHVYTGAMALKLSLVDKIGGLMDALADVRHRAGLDGQHVRFAFFPSLNPFGPIFEETEGQIHLQDFSMQAQLNNALKSLEPLGRTQVWLLPDPSGRQD